MKLKHIVFIGTALLGLLIAVPFFIPMGTYLPKIEQMVSEKTGLPVTIKSLHIALFPSPRATVGEISIGKNTDLHIRKVTAIIDIRSLFSPVKVISHLEVHQPVVKESALGLISELAKQEHPSASTSVLIRHIALHEAKLELDGLKLPLMNGMVDMNKDALEQARFISTDGKLELNVTPKDKGFEIAAHASQWITPVGLPLLLDDLRANASFAGTRLTVSSFRTRLYEGIAEGNAELDWTKSWKLSGKLKIERMEVGKPARLFSKAVQVSGKMTGHGTFSSSAAKPEELANKILADFRFNVEHGVLRGMDLAKAASLFIKQGQSGGETEFDELSGILHATGKRYEVRELQVVSGLLAANGHVSISPAKNLDGQMDVELKKGLALVTVPLNISGTLDAPVVMPTKAAVAGATAGTAVLGPLGTALGMKAGSAMDRWFGGKK